MPDQNPSIPKPNSGYQKRDDMDRDETGNPGRESASQDQGCGCSGSPPSQASGMMPGQRQGENDETQDEDSGMPGSMSGGTRPTGDAANRGPDQQSQRNNPDHTGNRGPGAPQSGQSGQNRSDKP